MRNADGTRRAIARETAWRILKSIAAENELGGRVGCHSWRKWFANTVYERLGRDIVKVQAAMGHRNLNSTAAYLASLREDEIMAAILAA